MLRRILTFPNPELKKKSQPVTIISDNTRDIVRDMTETMYNSAGVGLAAPQIGIHQRIIVIDVSGKDETPHLTIAVNPVIIHSEGESYEEEGCLSIPRYAANVRRHLRVVVRALNLDGEEFTCNADNLLAIAFQHEIDHLDGILFVDHLSPLKREIFRKRYLRSLEGLQEQE